MLLRLKTKVCLASAASLMSFFVFALVRTRSAEDYTLIDWERFLVLRKAPQRLSTTSDKWLDGRTAKTETAGPSSGKRYDPD